MSLINNPKHMQSKIFSSESLAWTHIYKTMLMLCAPNIFIFVLTTINKLTPPVSVMITQIEAPCLLCHCFLKTALLLPKFPSINFYDSLSSPLRLTFSEKLTQRLLSERPSSIVTVF